MAENPIRKWLTELLKGSESFFQSIDVIENELRNLSISTMKHLELLKEEGLNMTKLNLRTKLKLLQGLESLREKRPSPSINLDKALLLTNIKV